MREILFRGKVIENGEWVQGFLMKRPSAVHIGEYSPWYIFVPPKDPEDNCHYWNVAPETIGQFTGLIAKEKQWFEHDIISVRNDNGEMYRFVIAFGVCGGVKNVKHTVGYTGFHFIPANEETRRCMACGARNDPLYWLNAYDCEVIGNIHDNPELLEGGAEDGK